MKKTVRNLVLISVFLFVMSFISVKFGAEYDERNKLYPETIQLSYDVFMGNVYGERWRKLSILLISSGLILDVIAIIIWYKSKRREDKGILELINKNL